MSTVNNIFLCTTEYHLMLSLQIVLSSYNNGSCNNVIFMTTGMRKNVSRYNCDAIPGIDFRTIDWFFLRTPEGVKSITSIRCDNFFYYLSNFIVHRYIVRCLKRRGAMIYLVQDGLKPYAKQPKRTFRSLLSNIYRNVLEAAKIRYICGVLWPFVSQKYVNDNKIDVFCLTNPEWFNCKISRRQKILKINYPFGALLKVINSFFNVPEDLNIFSSQGGILYIAQPLPSAECIEVEMSFLKKLQSLYPNKRLFVKFHPSPNMHKKAFYENILDAIFLDDFDFPVELLMMSLNRFSIVSPYSASLMAHNFLCSYFFIYPIFKNCCGFNYGMELAKIDIDYIHVVSKPGEIYVA